MNFLVAKNLGFLPFFLYHPPHKNIRSERKYRHEISSSNVESTVGWRKGGQWLGRWREILASMGALNHTSVLWKAIQRGVKLTLLKKWVLQWSNMYSNTSKSIGWMSQKSILWKKKNSLKKKNNNNNNNNKNRKHGFPNHGQIIAIGQNSRKDFVPHDILYHRISCYSFNLYFNLKQRVRSWYVDTNREQLIIQAVKLIKTARAISWSACLWNLNLKLNDLINFIHRLCNICN